jgi:hypothetical protein
MKALPWVFGILCDPLYAFLFGCGVTGRTCQLGFGLLSVRLPCLLVLVSVLLWRCHLRGHSRFISVASTYHCRHVTVEMKLRQDRLLKAYVSLVSP